MEQKEHDRHEGRKVRGGRKKQKERKNERKKEQKKGRNKKKAIEGGRVSCQKLINFPAASAMASPEIDVRVNINGRGWPYLGLTQNIVHIATVGSAGLLDTSPNALKRLGSDFNVPEAWGSL